MITSYQKQHILSHGSKGLKPLTIAHLLLEEKSKKTFESVEFRFTSFFVGIVKQHRASIARKPGSGRPSRITQEIKQIGEAQMQEDDKTSAMQLHALLKNKGINISRCRIILRCRSSLGWIFRGSAYCQMIRQANKEKRLEFARRKLQKRDIHG